MMFSKYVVDGVSYGGEVRGVLVVDFVAGGGIVVRPEFEFGDEGVHGCGDDAILSNGERGVFPFNLYFNDRFG